MQHHPRDALYAHKYPARARYLELISVRLPREVGVGPQVVSIGCLVNLRVQFCPCLVRSALVATAEDGPLWGREGGRLGDGQAAIVMGVMTRPMLGGKEPRGEMTVSVDPVMTPSRSDASTSSRLHFLPTALTRLESRDPSHNPFETHQSRPLPLPSPILTLRGQDIPPNPHPAVLALNSPSAEGHRAVTTSHRTVPSAPADPPAADP